MTTTPSSQSCPFCGSREFARDSWGFTCALCHSVFPWIVTDIPPITSNTPDTPIAAPTVPTGSLTYCKHDFPSGLCPYCKDEEIEELKAKIKALRSNRPPSSL